MHVLRTLRSVAAAAALAGVAVGGTQLVAAPLAQAKFSTLSTTAAVNLRQSPSTSAPVVTVLAQGTTVTQTGSTQNGWTPVRVNGRTGWIYASYLAGTVSSTPTTSATAKTSGTATVVESVNLRTGPGTDYPVVRVLPKGTRVTLTGTKRGLWVQVRDGGQLRWVHGAWLSTATSSTPTTTTTVKAKSKARATADLMIRTSSGSNFTSLGDIPAGTILQLTGKRENGVAQIIWQGQLRWVNANFLVPVSNSTSVSTPAAPKTTGSRYATVALAIRTTSGSDSRTVGEVPAGTKLRITGVVKNGRAQIVYQGAVRWVTAKYLSLIKPVTTPATVTTNYTGTLNTGGSSGLDSLTAAGKGIVYEVRANYSQITTMYGVRADPLPDHPTGHAVDIMLPNYRSNTALGWDIANHMRANASRLGIKYIIFHQHIWSVARDGEGWRLMADRGGDTANHMDHVHVTVN